MFRRSSAEMRVIILAPIGRDAALLAQTLGAFRIDTAIAADADTLLQTLEAGVGCAIVAEEGLPSESIGKLARWLADQPPWSDVPFIVLTSHGRPTQESDRRVRDLQPLGNFTLIERPARRETIESAVRSALRARMRQYEIRKRQEELVQANADLEQFAYSASHDFREPLRSIQIFSGVLEKNYRNVLDESGVQFLDQIRSGAARMEALLTDLLSYAHASSIAEEAVAPIDANKPLQAALDSLAGAIREVDAKITVGDLPAVKMRESHLTQLFQNLVSNALKYRREDSLLQIDISAESANGQWIFSVADNGIGIAADYSETIFGLFKRLHSNDKYSGSGMGLAICKRIVERYRGRIWVESKEGQGSKFLFSIPA